MNRAHRSFLWLAFFVAGVLHWELRMVPSPLGLSYLDQELAKKQANEPITVEKLEDPNDPRHTIVQSSRAKEEKTEEDKKARFGAEFKNRVKKETKSISKGRFQEGKSLRSPEIATGEEDPNGEESLPKLKDLLAFGATPNELGDEIAEGNETLLNTDPVRYASFINRIADEIYDAWVIHAKEAVRSLYNFGKKVETNTYITRLQIVMDSNGEVRAIQTMKSSGIPELDEAPKKAFWESEPFRNPPVQMFDKETIVRFTYEFHFKWETSAFDIVPWAI